MAQSRDRHTEAAKSNYATGDNLRKRQALGSFIVDFVGTSPDVFLSALPSEGVVVDVGCGNGMWAQRVVADERCVIGLDSSAGLAREFQAQSVGPAVWADAHELPFASASVDAVMMLWMLYHVQDKQRALAEAARVLRPGGVLVAATNTREDGGRHVELIVGALEESVGRKLSSWLPDLDFHSANGAAILEPHFASVEAHTWEAVYELTEADPLVGYLDSLREPIEAEVGEALDWDDVLGRLERNSGNEMKVGGPLRFVRGGSVFIARVS